MLQLILKLLFRMVIRSLLQLHQEILPGPKESARLHVRLAGNPELATVLKVISAQGLQLHVSATDKAKLAV
jgi:hypothetical protein